MIPDARRTAVVEPVICAPRGRLAAAGVRVPASNISSVCTSQSIVTSALTGDGPDLGSARSFSTGMWNRSVPIVKS
jgi:hypothetical protein